MNDFINPYRTEYFPEPLPAVVERKMSKHSPDRVKFYGRSWLVRINKDARNERPLAAGETIWVYGRHGLHLLALAPPSNLI